MVTIVVFLTAAFEMVSASVLIDPVLKCIGTPRVAVIFSCSVIQNTLDHHLYDCHSVFPRSFAPRIVGAVAEMCSIHGDAKGLVSRQ